MQAATDAPRFPSPVSARYPPTRKNAFRVLPPTSSPTAGYTIKREAEFDEKSEGVWGDSELIAVDPKTGELRGGQDHRHRFGKAAGY